MTMFQNLFRSMRGSERLQARCEACGRRAAWTYAEAKAAFGPDATPMAIRARLRCAACGAARATVWI